MRIMNPPTTPKRRRRWLQFSLRTLFVGVLLAGCVLGWVAGEFEKARRHSRAADAITKLGGSAEFWGEPPISSWRRKLLGEHLGRDVVVVYLNGSEATDADLVSLRDLRGLKFLYLTETRLTDAGMECLGGFTQLRGLSLANTQVTDAGLNQLQGLRQLRVLRFENTHVTDAGIMELQQFLPNTQIVR
jgi:hypothetical protein